MCRASTDPNDRRCTGKCTPRDRSARDRARYGYHNAVRATAQRLPVDPTRPAATTPTAFVDGAVSPESSVDELRLLAAQVAAAYEGADTTVLDDVYGSRLGALRALGAVVVMRAEEIAGITGAEAHKRHEDRLADMIEAGNEFEAFRSGLHDGQDRETYADLRRLAQGYLAALAEIRPMGGDLDAQMREGYDDEALSAVSRAAQDYPADWVAASNARGPLHVTTADRGFYRDGETYIPEILAPVEPGVWLLPAGTDPTDAFLHSPPRMVAARVPDEDADGDEAWLVTSQDFVPGDDRPPGEESAPYDDGTHTGWARPLTEVTGYGPAQIVGLLALSAAPGRHGLDSSPYAPVTTHELAHRMEHSVPGVGAMEADWIADRITVDGQREDLASLGGAYGTHEVGYRDHFLDHYIGRTYDQDLTPGGHEVVSMGWEAMVHGRMGGLVGASDRHRGGDDDLRWLVLGALAAAGLPWLAALDLDSLTGGLI